MNEVHHVKGKIRQAMAFETHQKARNRAWIAFRQRLMILTENGPLFDTYNLAINGPVFMNLVPTKMIYTSDTMIICNMNCFKMSSVLLYFDSLSFIIKKDILYFTLKYPIDLFNSRTMTF